MARQFGATTFFNQVWGILKVCLKRRPQRACQPARTVPVRHECEGPVLELLHGRDLNASVFDGMEPGSGQVGVIAEHARLHVNDASLRPQRLRTTRIGLVTASGAPRPALMRAAAITGERTFTHVAAALDAPSTVHALGRLLRLGLRHWV